MTHPLEINLRELNDDKLQDRVSMLYERLRYFSGHGNMHVINQLRLFLDQATQEQARRSEELMSISDKNKNEN